METVDPSTPPFCPKQFSASPGLPKWLRDILEASSTFQAIMREGYLEGYAIGQRETLLEVLRYRFTRIPLELEARISGITHYTRLKAALRQALHINSPDELTL